jgi:hypothetical protein
MKIKENDFIIDGVKIGTYLSYTDVEPELKEMKFGDRVLPAPFFYEKNIWFSLIRQYAPGDSKFFPDGGFEIRSLNGSVHNYALDQVVLHPSIIKHQKTLDKMVRRVEKIQTKRERELKRKNKPQKPKVEGARRGRPALDPEVKAARVAAKLESAQRSGGKRGRPASTTPKILSNGNPKPKGKRGRPTLSQTVIAQRDNQKITTNKRTGGKRGRPKSNHK